MRLAKPEQKKRKDLATWCGMACLRRKPSEAFRPAMWQDLGGVFYARSSDRETRFMGFNIKAAQAWSQVFLSARLPRISYWTYGDDIKFRRYQNEKLPDVGSLVLWVVDPT